MKCVKSNRVLVGTDLLKENKTARRYREELVSDLPIIKNEPATLYSQNVLIKAKHEAKVSDQHDKDLYLSLISITQSHEFADFNFDVGLHPFYAIYISKMQIEIYKKAFSLDPMTVCIDATGQIAQKISYNKNILLYQIVVPASDGRSQFPVAQMLSAKHTTVAIIHFLLIWLQCGAPIPNMIISDQCRVLLNAMAFVFLW